MNCSVGGIPGGIEKDETENWVEDECQEAKEPPKLEDNTTQTTPTSDGESNIPEIPTQTESSYIAEPVTMTTTANSRDLADEEKREGSQATVTFSEDTTIVDTDDDTTQEQKQEHQQRPEHQKIPDRTEEMAVTFRLGNVMMANSLKPNSAVRQLFPSPRFVSPPPGRSPEDDGITGGKKSPESDEDDGLQNNLIKRTIERNTLRRSMLRYPADIRLKRNQNRVKNDNSLVERIKRLTCDLDEETEPAKEERTSPTGEESSDAIGYLGLSSPCLAIAPTQHTSFRRIPDLYARKEPHPVVLQAPASVEHQYPYYRPMYTTTTPVPPDLGNGVPPHPPLHLHLSAVPPQQVMLPPPAPPPTSLPQQHPPKPAHPRASVTAEARKQFLSTLAPLAACVSSNKEDAQDMLLSPPGTRDSLASSSAATDNTEYSIGDIDDALKTETVPKPRPDVVAGTPGNEQPTDELAVFVQQDASRIERLRKRYSGGSTEQEEPPYQQQRPEFGFDRRPSVRGIKPRFGSTTEILQQMQSQMTPPLPAAGGGHVSWPYYADAGKTPPGVNGYHRRPQQFLQARLPEYGDDALYPQGQLQRAGPRPAFRAGGMQLQQVVEAPRQVVVRGTQTISTGYYGVPPRPPPLFYYPGGSPVPCGSPTKMKLERGVPEGASASPALHHEQASAPPPLQHNAMMYAMNV
ncbi:hypothetical protein AAG570_005045 [Ranatra chinensis]|uniref:Uncharacterized protein n=1 Tax=Ranatra chinensis TaxID=642074 RepID=A0ABD0XZM4_9HEMI